jgi:hypothetical protein
MTSTAPTPKELSDRLEALRRLLRDSGKIGTESPENYELVSILNGIAALEGQSIEGMREQKTLKLVFWFFIENYNPQSQLKDDVLRLRDFLIPELNSTTEST